MASRSSRIPRSLPLLVVGALLFAASGAWADFQQIRINSDATQQLQNEQQVCVNPNDSDNVVAVWRDFRLGYRQVGVGTSFDGGYSWIDFLIGGDYPWDSDPVLIVDDDGTFFLVVINYEQNGPNQLSVWRSATGGVSWEGPFTAVHSGGATFEDKEWIAVDRTGGVRDGNLYVSWSRFYDVKVMCVASTDRGATWSNPVQVSDPGHYAQWSVPIVLRNGNVLVAWNKYYDTRILYDISANGGVSWGTDRTLTTTSTGPQDQINGGITVFPYPSLVMDESSGPRDGWVYCVYADRAIGANGMDIWCRRSTDDGNSWSDRVRVNDDPAGQSRDQFHPWVTCDTNGNLTAIWYDRRDDPGNYLWHIYMSRSEDGGSTWTDNVRITDVASSPGDAFVPEEPKLGPPLPLEQLRAGLIGEYSGVAVGGGVAHPVWTDTRNGHQDTFTSVVPLFPTGVDGLAGDRTALRLRGHPNPMCGSVDLHLRLPAVEGATVEIADPAGRLVRTIPLGDLVEGESIVPWDGRDDAGVDLPAGVYFARVSGLDRLSEVRTKVVLTR